MTLFETLVTESVCFIDYTSVDCVGGLTYKVLKSGIAFEEIVKF